MKIALLQLNSGSDIEKNIAAIYPLVADAAAQKAQLVAMPENCFLMEDHGKERSLNIHYDQENHPGILAARNWAKELNLSILIGSVNIAENIAESSAESGKSVKSYNRSLLLNPHGEITAQYDKIHLFDVDVPGDRSYRESDKILAGSKAVVAPLFPTINHQPSTINLLLNQQPATINQQPLLGLTICYDLRFPQLYRHLAKAGAKIIAVPAAFTKITGEAHWHVLLRARAIENGCFIIAPAQTGIHSGKRETYGHSLVVNPWGEVLADSGVETGISVVEIDLSESDKVRELLPSLKHDHDFLPTSA